MSGREGSVDGIIGRRRSVGGKRKSSPARGATLESRSRVGRGSSGGSDLGHWIW